MYNYTKYFMSVHTGVFQQLLDQRYVVYPSRLDIDQLCRETLIQLSLDKL